MNPINQDYVDDYYKSFPIEMNHFPNKYSYRLGLLALSLIPLCKQCFLSILFLPMSYVRSAQPERLASNLLPHQTMSLVYHHLLYRRQR